jgi:thioredoxin reductase (NADPH)
MSDDPVPAELLPAQPPPETPDPHGAYPRLNDAQIESLSRWGTRRATVRGEILCPAGERSANFFVLLAGQAVVLTGYPHAPRVIRVHGPGRFLGELSVLTGQVEFVTTAINVPGQVLELDAQRLREIVTRDPELGELILRAYLIRRSMLIGEGAGFHIIGSRFSADSRRLRAFVARNRLPHRFLDIEENPDAEQLLEELHVPAEDLPVVIVRGQEILRNPTNAELAERVGMTVPRTPPDICDLVIVGAGPAGLAAGVYGASEGLTTVILDGIASGGQAATSSRIENYLGFPSGISGSELAERAAIQAEKFGARMSVPGEAIALHRGDGHYTVHVDGDTDIPARSVVLAMGAKYRKLDVARLAEFEMTSVYYAATNLEASQCAADPVAVVGGGNSAGQAAIFLARHCPRVYLLILHDDLGRDMSHYLVDQIEADPRIELLPHTRVRELLGTNTLEGLLVEDTRTEACRRLDVRALFTFIGVSPCTKWLRKPADDAVPDAVALDENGFVLTGDQVPDIDPDARPLFLESNWPAVFAVGDVRSGSVKRVASAVGEGAMAVRFIHQRLG